MVTAIFNYIIPITLGLVLITFSLMGLSKSKNDPPKRKKDVRVLCLGIVIIVFALCLIVFF
jgi:Na+-driven multidrug efflux pump